MVERPQFEDFRTWEEYRNALFDWHMDSLTEAQRKKIRKRESYRMWFDIHFVVTGNHTMSEILHSIYDLLDSKRSFGSMTNSSYARESLKQYIKDMKLD